MAVELVGTERVSIVGYGCVGRGGLLWLLARYRSRHHAHGARPTPAHQSGLSCGLSLPSTTRVAGPQKSLVSPTEMRWKDASEPPAHILLASGHRFESDLGLHVHSTPRSKAGRVLYAEDLEIDP